MIEVKKFIIFSTLFVVALSHGKGNKCSPDLMGLAKCCQLPSDLSSTKFFNVEECKSLEPTGEGKEIYKAKACHTECVFKSKGILNESGEVDRAKFVEWTETVLKDYPEFMESAKSVIDKCFDYALKRKNGKPEGDDTKKCGLLPMMISKCTFGSLVRNCPASKQIDSEECKAVRAKVESEGDC